MNNLFNETQINEVYQKFVVKPQEYLNKLSPLPIHLNNKNWRWETKDFARIPCIIDFSEWVTKYDITHVKKLLTTDMLDPELEYITYDEVDCFPYENGKNDLHTLQTEKKYDFIIFNQTIEHLYNPFISLKNLYDSLNEGGYLFTSVPTINIPHMMPSHFNGYTPMGLCMLMKSVNFEIMELGYWGNYNYISRLFSSHMWPSYESLTDENFNISNEPQNVTQCWILVRK
jgi:hypothetical protein